MVQEETASPDADCDVPWINTDLIQRALESSSEQTLEVVGVSVCLATAPGDNYSSTIYRVQATLADGGQRSVLVKEPPPGKEMAGFIEKVGIFRRETGMLAEVVPDMEALLEDAHPGRFPPLAARCPLHGTVPVNHIVLQDLKPEGFQLADRRRGLGLRHSLLSLRALARFHAASYALLQQRPALAERFDSTWRYPNNGMDNFVEGGVQSAADVCRSWPGFEEYATLLEKFKVKIMEKSIELNDPRPGAFNVMVHGDFWINNLMFRYEDGLPIDFRMVDLQISHVASPAIDLLYFLTTSVSENVSIKYEELLLREYHFALEKTMWLLGMKAPSLATLLADIDAHGPFALFGLLIVLPLAKATRKPDIDASIAGEQSATSYLYKTPEMKRWLQRILPEYKHKGWLQKC